MSTNNKTPLEKFQSDWKSNQKYFDMLAMMSSLSKLFSDNSVPYLDYRLAENLFCKYFDAQNDARSCTAYDARLSSLGIGIKTFILKNDNSIEKIAEFNHLKPHLDRLSGIDLARKLGEFRNERMQLANRMYSVAQTQYHIVGRSEGVLKIFNTPYEEVSIDNVKVLRETLASLSFVDDKHEYFFNKSKSVLQKRFVLPDDFKEVKVDLISDPLALLEELLHNKSQTASFVFGNKGMSKGTDYVILPLYAEKSGEKYVAEKSGLNQWNAGGRKRDDNEVYIPVPKVLRNKYPDFFPGRDMPFELELPDGRVLQAKICQDGGKALMSNPNSDLGEYLLRKVLQKEPGKLVTMFDLNKYGFDSICIEKLHHQKESIRYKLYFTENYGNFDSFLEEEEE